MKPRLPRCCARWSTSFAACAATWSSAAQSRGQPLFERALKAYTPPYDPAAYEREVVTRAAVAAGTTTDATWAGPLAALQPLTDAVVELVRAESIVGKIPGLRKVPFNVSVAAQSAGGTYGWIGQGAPNPVTKLDFVNVTLAFAKVSGIIVMSQELMRLSTPSAEALALGDFTAGIAAF
jgi:HK97 family phage major capsid protein